MSELSAQLAALSASQTKSGEAEAAADKVQRLEDSRRLKEALDRAHQAQEGRGFWSSLGAIVSDVAHDLGDARVADAFADLKDDTVAMVRSPAFWRDIECGAGTVAKWALLAGGVGLGAVALASGVGSKNAGEAILGGVGIALSIAGAIVSETKCFGDESELIGAGLEGAGSLSSGIGLLAGGTEASQAAKAATAVAASATIVGGGASVLRGGAQVPGAIFAHAASLAQTDAVDAQHAIERDGERIRRLTDLLGEVSRSNRDAVAALESANTTAGQALLASTSKRG
jgi:hypothetical protein